MVELLQEFADAMLLGPLLDRVQARAGGYRLLEHWTQGEFHHDVVLRVEEPGELPGSVLVVSTNCNGGVKEVLCFAEVPERWALWHARCPDVPEFSGELTPLLGQARTRHWFEPCELLAEDARSELRPEYRERQRGGGWVMRAPKRSGGGGG
ncbi:MAG: hypothetical protein CMH57_01725 [Myxococcales bacterium]|nr:hypothetical protein [Myxococcales bacterium]